MVGNLFFGWVIVASSFLIFAVAYGLHFCYAVFLPFIAEDLDLGRAAVAAPLSAYIAVYSLLSVVTGPLTDKFGPKNVVLIGGILLGLGYLLLSRAHTVWHAYMSLSVIAAMGMSAAFVPLNSTIVKWFVIRRGTALGFAGSGMNVGAIVGPMAVAYVLPWLGWRTTLMIIAIVGGVTVVACALVLSRDPESRGLRPDGLAEDHTIDGSASGVSSEISWTRSEAMQTPAFWMILGLFLFTWSILFFPFAHLPSLVVDLGYHPTTAASMVGAIGVGGFIGRMAIGWLSDALGRMRALYISLALQAIACALFVHADSLSLLYLAAVLFSVGGSSGATLFPAVVGDMFGRQHVGAISGSIFAIASAAGAFGPYMAGLVRDTTGTYDKAFMIGAIFNVIALVLAALLRTPRRM